MIQVLCRYLSLCILNSPSSYLNSHGGQIPQFSSSIGQVVCFDELIYEICVKSMIVLKLHIRAGRSSSLPKGAKHLLGQKKTPPNLHFTTNKAKNCVPHARKSFQSNKSGP